MAESSAPRPVKPCGLWLDDLAEGMTFSSGTYEVTEAGRSRDFRMEVSEPKAMRGIYVDELARLDAYAREQALTGPQ